MMSTQYLQVPKPTRKSRSRSKPRPREVVSVQEVHILPTKDRPRLGSPPIPSPELSVNKPSMHNTLSTGYKRGDIGVSIRPLAQPSPPSQQYQPPQTNGYSRPEIKEIQPPTPAVSPSLDLGDLNGEMYTLADVATPPPELPLRQKIIGAWKLESYIAYPTPDSNIQRPTYPMTKNVTGFIMYTPDGYMSAQMLIPGQQSFKRGEGEEPQWAEAGKRFFAYSGPYYINNEGPGRQEILRHTFQVCNLPGWIGDVQIRTHHFEDDGQVLVLGSEEPTEIKGDKRIPVLKWRRARNNMEGDPPPPTPQIKISGPVN